MLQILHTTVFAVIAEGENEKDAFQYVHKYSRKSRLNEGGNEDSSIAVHFVAVYSIGLTQSFLYSFIACSISFCINQFTTKLTIIDAPFSFKCIQSERSIFPKVNLPDKVVSLIPNNK